MAQYETAYFCELGQHGTATSHTTYQVSTGYGTYANGKKSCVDCIGIADKEELLQAPIGTKFVHYLTGNMETGYTVSNWPGTFKYKCYYASESWHNIGNRRIDIWFTMSDKNGQMHKFWGYTIGRHNQLCHIRKIK